MEKRNSIEIKNISTKKLVVMDISKISDGKIQTLNAQCGIYADGQRYLLPGINNNSLFPNQNTTMTSNEFFLNWPRPAEVLPVANVIPSNVFACPFHIPVFNIQPNNYGSKMFENVIIPSVREPRQHKSKTSFQDNSSTLNGLVMQQISMLREKPSSVTDSKSTTSNDERASTSSSTSGSDFINKNVLIPSTTSDTNSELLLEFTRLALSGCDIAEKLAYSHRTRPCFKKIDSLCARLKQDLTRADSVLANINSQGITWAVKDFIFVFTRIINAWTIIKGYIYNTPEGLDRIKSTLSNDFTASFFRWQEATMDFVENLIDSYVNLDQLVQNQRGSYHKFDNKTKNKSKDSVNNVSENATNDNISGSDVKNDEPKNLTKSVPIQKIVIDDHPDLLKTVQNSEETQIKASVDGTYFKTAVYSPLKMEKEKCQLPLKMFETKSLPPPLTTLSKKKTIHLNHKADILNWIGIISNDCVQAKNLSFAALPQTILRAPSQSHSLVNSSDRVENDAKQGDNLNLNNTGSCTNASVANDESNEKNIKKNLDQSNKVTKNIVQSVENSNAKVINELRNKLMYLIENVCYLDESKYFIKAQFTENYFPDFLSLNPNYVDLRSIVIKFQGGGYNNANEVIHDLRQIVYTVKLYLKNHPQDNLIQTINIVESEINKTLAEEVFSAMNFDNITGSPDDIIDSTLENCVKLN